MRILLFLLTTYVFGNYLHASEWRLKNFLSKCVIISSISFQNFICLNEKRSRKAL